MRQQLGVVPTLSLDDVTKSYVDSVVPIGGTPDSYGQLIGDGSSTSIVVSHFLGTRDVIMSVKDTTTWQEVNCDKFATSTNTATFVFASAPTTNQFRVTIAGGVLNSASLGPTAVKTADYSGTGNEFVPADASGGVITITFPVAPADLTRFAVKKIDSSAHHVLLATGGSDVFDTASGPTTGTLTSQNQGLTAQYVAASGIWYVISTAQGGYTP